jgi:hypothetical protein
MIPCTVLQPSTGDIYSLLQMSGYLGYLTEQNKKNFPKANIWDLN